MRTCIFLALGLSSALLPAQSIVTNGDFSNGITGWTESGVSYNPIVELHNTDGVNTSNAYGCGPGGSVYAPPHAPNYIEQSIFQVPGIAYEFTADLSVDGLNGNAHAGLCYVEVNGVEIGRIDFGNFSANKTERNRLTLRYTTAAAGPTTLRIHFQRPPYIYTASTPRMHIDNVAINFAATPTFSIPANRQIGTTLPFDLDGGPASANSPFGLLIAAAEQNPPIQLPGVQGVLGLDPISLAVLGNGTFDVQGRASMNIAVPALPALTGVLTWFQGACINGGTLNLGLHHGLAFTN